MGMPIFESNGASRSIVNGDELEVKPSEGVILNLTQGEEYTFEPFPPFMVDLIQDGGLNPYLLKEGIR
jgi:3-isopropylmalate/(R)-2-methylmalate dehydratase small subunit